MKNWQEVLEQNSRMMFERVGRGLLLSRVPAVLREENIDFRELLQGRKLREFLQAEAGDRLKLIQSEENATLWALVPSDANVSEPYSRFFPSSEIPPENRPPRFKSAVWQAFIRRLAPENDRWLLLGPPTTFEDLDSRVRPETGVQVEREFVVDQEEIFRANDTVIGNIEKWAAKHEIDVQQLLVSPRFTETISRVPKSALVDFLKALRPEERNRISIPADIAARLLGL